MCSSFINHLFMFLICSLAGLRLPVLVSNIVFYLQVYLSFPSPVYFIHLSGMFYVGESVLLSCVAEDWNFSFTDSAFSNISVASLSIYFIIELTSCLLSNKNAYIWICKGHRRQHRSYYIKINNDNHLSVTPRLQNILGLSKGVADSQQRFEKLVCLLNWCKCYR